MYNWPSIALWAAELGGLVKRARRGIVLGVLALLGGAVVSLLAAEGIGLSGVAHYDGNAPQRFVAVGGKYIHAYDVAGRGWRHLMWRVEDQGSAAVSQYMYDNHLSGFNGRLLPSYLHCDPPESLPPWSNLWRPALWPRDVNMGSYVQTNESMELAAGWPFLAFSMDWDTSRPHEFRGGTVHSSVATGRLRFLPWRPIPLGFALDALIYAACIAALAAGVRLFVRARRQRRGACAACGYDLRGLAAGAACPECGRAGDGTKVTA
jgi:hypothetical protein